VKQTVRVKEVNREAELFSTYYTLLSLTGGERSFVTKNTINIEKTLSLSLFFLYFSLPLSLSFFSRSCVCIYKGGGESRKKGLRPFHRGQAAEECPIKTKKLVSGQNRIKLRISHDPAAGRLISRFLRQRGLKEHLITIFRCYDMRRSVPFRDSRGRVVPWGYVFLTDGPTAEEVANLFQRAFGRRATIDAPAWLNLIPAAIGPGSGQKGAAAG
jgi:hypothetical protein